MNKELKQYLYTLVRKELTYEDKEKILMYFNQLKEENDRLRVYKSIINKLKRFCSGRGDYEDYVIINYIKELEDNKRYTSQTNSKIIYEDLL